MTDWLWILAGLALLAVAAETLVRGSVWCALALGISPMMIGVTLVAFGTSLPELIVCVEAALRGKPGIALGNVVGSNIANVGLIVGVAALVRPISEKWSAIGFEMRFMVVTTALAALLILPFDVIGRIHGLALLCGLALFSVSLIARERRRAGGYEPRAVRAPAKPAAFALNAGLVLGGLVGLHFGAEWLVLGASGVARGYGVSDQTIGLTIVAVGTSLPELAAAVAAALRGQSQIALGNVLGSNVFNLCMVLGATSLISPLPFDWRESRAPVGVMVLFTIGLSTFARSRRGISRPEAAILLLGYLGYVTFEVF